MKNYLQILELEKIFLEISKLAKTSIAKEDILKMEYIKNYSSLLNEQNIVKEFTSFIKEYGSMPLDDIFDIYSFLDKAQKDNVLNIEELYLIKLTLGALDNLNKYKSSIAFNFPLINQFLEKINVPKDIKIRLDKVIIDEENIADDSSPQLKNIRNSIRKKEQEIKNKLQAILNKNVQIMNESIIYYRNNRYLLPIKSSHKYQLGGIVHEVSSSGLTCFVEPQAVVELGYQLSSIIEDEKKEIFQILKNISNLIKINYQEIFISLSNAITLDFYSAKANYGKLIDGLFPTFVEDYHVDIIGARHLLIEPQKVVPNDFFLDQKRKILLISGPNAGGKTVALKTFGMIIILAQLGLAIPTSKEAILPVFDNIFIDIGDEQSLEQSLSTFSSHLKKIVDFTNNLNEKSLIIIDEIGAGTDPKEGETLAMALLDYIKQKNATALVTTHYSNLKIFGLTSDYIEVASLKFNEENLTSTYKLIIGKPGKSYAFYIAKSLGLNEQIIDNAQIYLQKYTLNSEKLEAVLNERLLAQDEIEKRLEEDRNLLQEKLNEQEIINENINKKLDEINFRASEMIQDLVDEALVNIDDYVQEFKNKNISLPIIAEVKNNIKNQQIKEHLMETTSKYQPLVGDYVLIKSLHQTGTIIGIRKDRYIIDTGSFNIESTSDDLEKAQVKKTKTVSKNFTIKNVPGEINLIGLRVEEALNRLEAYLDSVRTSNLKNVRIIHGYGTGALKNAIFEYLSGRKYIISYRSADYNQGGAGATMVTLK